MINKIELMRRISLTIILFFYLLFVFYYVAVYSPQPGRNNFNNFLSITSLNIYELMVLLLIVSILFVEVIPLVKSLSFKKFIVNHQKFFINYYPYLSVFLTTFGFFISFISALFKNFILVQIGIAIFLSGIFLWAIMFNIKIYLESQISYAIYEANRSINAINPNEPQQIKQFIRFINLTLNNINLKFGRKIKLNISGSGIYQFETILQDYLPYYLKMGGTRELDALKEHIERMSDSVSSDNTALGIG